MTIVLEKSGGGSSVERREVSVNGAVISMEAIADEAQNHPSDRPDTAWREAACALAVREMLLQEARGRDLTATAQLDEAGRRETQDEALVRTLLDEDVVTPKATEEECHRYYDNNLERHRTPDLYEVAHILFSADRDDEASFVRATEEARAVIGKLSDAPHLFERMAKDRSDCPTGREGGRLGQVTRGQTTPDFERVMVTLSEGELHPEPVATPYGVHVMKLERKALGQVVPFETARPRIAAYLEEASWRRAAAQYVALLAGRAKIDGVEIDGAQSPLVQ